MSRVRRSTALALTSDNPIHIPVNACGDSVSVIGPLNPAFGNTCANA